MKPALHFELYILGAAVRLVTAWRNHNNPLCFEKEAHEQGFPSMACTMSEALVSHVVEAPSNALPIWRRSALAAEFEDAFISDTDLEGGTCADGVWSRDR